MRTFGRARVAALAAVAVGLLAGCADAWAQSIAQEIARDLDRMESFQGVTVEHHLSAEGPVRRSVLQARPWRARVETLAPASHAGELFLYDGTQVVMWWPQQRFGIRVRGLPAPERAAVRRHIERMTRATMNAYSLSMRGDSARVAGRSTHEWRVTPTRSAAYRHRHRVWNDQRYPMPLRMTFVDDAGAPWYGFEFESITFDAPVADDAFAFEFPRNAVVFEWDLAAPGISLEEARERMNFDVKLPRRLPAGHAVEKIVEAEHCLPMIAVVMSRGASTLSLTQSRDMGLARPPLGKTVTFGGKTGVLSFLGTFSTVTWVQDGTLLSLTGNVGYPELLAVAESVE
jgi:outer membrane lipoprotein-sorting protein